MGLGYTLLVSWDSRFILQQRYQINLTSILNEAQLTLTSQRVVHLQRGAPDILLPVAGGDQRATLSGHLSQPVSLLESLSHLSIEGICVSRGDDRTIFALYDDLIAPINVSYNGGDAKNATVLRFRYERKNL